jgi:tripartite-type tricarboxylate transporter receptor subunit TctC
MTEAGFPGNEAYAWMGVVAPAATPDAEVRRLNGALAAAIDNEEVRRRLGELGAEPMGGPPERFGAALAEEAAARIPLIHELGLMLDL